MGLEIVDGRMQNGAPIPQELESYRVKFRAINGYEQIEYESHWKQSGILRNNLALYEKVNKIYTVDKSGTADIPIQSAWVALQRYGANVRSAKRAALQQQLWRYEEIRPKSVGRQTNV